MRIIRLPELDTPIPAGARRLPGNDGRFVEVDDTAADALLAAGAAPVREYVYDVPERASEAPAIDAGVVADEVESAAGKSRRR